MIGWRIPLAVGGVVFAIGAASIMSGVLPLNLAHHICPPMEEGPTYTIETELWPPGGRRCVIESGTERRVVTDFPWGWWLELGFTALLAAALAAALGRFARSSFPTSP